MNPDQFKARIDQIFADLEQYSYYELLNLAPQATPDDVRAAFHRMALSVHPDRFAASSDELLRKKIYTIYKRMTEGYRVLMDPADRRAYDEQLARGEPRFLRTQRKGPSLKRADDGIEPPKARQFFQMATDAARRGDLKGARLNYKFALNLAPEHPVILAALEQLDQKEQK